MNNDHTIKIVAQIIRAYRPDVHGIFSAEEAMEKIGIILKEANPTKAKDAAPATGCRVVDTEGGTHDYPTACAVYVERSDLYLNDEDNKTIAVFHRWEYVERISA